MSKTRERNTKRRGKSTRKIKTSIRQTLESRRTQMREEKKWKKTTAV